MTKHERPIWDRGDAIDAEMPDYYYYRYPKYYAA